MTSIHLKVTGAYVVADTSGRLTEGMVGIPITIEYDNEWDNLYKTLVCKSVLENEVTERTQLCIGNETTVAHEVMIAGRELYIGVEGRNSEGTIVLPTVWAGCGVIWPSVNAQSDPSMKPDNPVWMNIQNQIGCLDHLNTIAKDNLVSAINELSGGGSGGTPNAVQFVPQELSHEQKNQARDNIDAQKRGDYALKSEIQNVPSWAMQDDKPKYTAAEIGADPAGTATELIGKHNTQPDSHSDIRLLIQELTQRLNTVANSDDVSLDQLSEIVAYIKSNKDLIDQISTGKVSVTDIINNLATNMTDKPLSAAMGVELKQLIDSITVPTKLSELEDDSQHRTTTDIEKQTWNEKLSQSDLQSGIDQALAQAKASGEFDGADGQNGVNGKDGANGGHYTPVVTQPDPEHITVHYEPSKPEMPPVDDVAIALPKGSGGGGSTDISLGITTAKVGQIAKIKAVNEIGKPTEWEPVDLPSGGGGTGFIGDIVWSGGMASVNADEKSGILSDGLYVAALVNALGTAVTDGTASLTVGGRWGAALARLELKQLSYGMRSMTAIFTYKNGAITIGGISQDGTNNSYHYAHVDRAVQNIVGVYAEGSATLDTIEAKLFKIL